MLLHLQPVEEGDVKKCTYMYIVRITLGFTLWFDYACMYVFMINYCELRH